ncbi:MAG: polysaccharide deacetylase [Pseudomonadota bacterium]
MPELFRLARIIPASRFSKSKADGDKLEGRRQQRPRQALIACLIALTLPGTSTASGASPPRAEQFIALSFDGSKSLPVWQKTLAFAERVPVRFTYFVSCTHFLLPEHRRKYRPPGRRPGRSDVGYAKSAEDLEARLGYVQQALDAGHEIGNHACGHFDGRRWSVAQWQQEFGEFRRILAGAWHLNGLEGEPPDWPARITSAVKGFRAPLLSINPAMFKTLKSMGYRYDASEGGYMHQQPVRGKAGLWAFKLAFIPEGRTRRLTLAMDYNLMQRQTGGRSSVQNRSRVLGRTYEALMRYFNNNYHGSRAPLHIGFHFAAWNGGGYRAALFKFAGSVCHRSDVRCGTYAELADRLEGREPARLMAAAPDKPQRSNWFAD